ncbi:MAG TPA: hypothetical protein VGH19_03980 [Verrucomicrobiae bacterium]
MPWLKKKPDPLTDRAKELSREIAQLEAEIQKLSNRKETPRPAVRSTALPSESGPVPVRPQPRPVHDPVFEEVNARKIAASTEPENTDAHYNDLGVRKYDLLALWRRIRNHFYGPPAHSPKLINYLAAGSIHGLRPLRYESRVARNRFIFYSVCLVIVLWIVVARFLGR